MRKRYLYLQLNDVDLHHFFAKVINSEKIAWKVQLRVQTGECIPDPWQRGTCEAVYGKRKTGLNFYGFRVNFTFQKVDHNTLKKLHGNLNVILASWPLNDNMLFCTIPLKTCITLKKPHEQISTKQWALGCVNSPPRPEGRSLVRVAFSL